MAKYFYHLNFITYKIPNFISHSKVKTKSHVGERGICGVFEKKNTLPYPELEYKPSKTSVGDTTSIRIFKVGILKSALWPWNLRGFCTQTNFVTVCAFFSKITTYWRKVRLVSYRWHSKEPNYCTGISVTQVVIDLCVKTMKILIFTRCLQ